MRLTNMTSEQLATFKGVAGTAALFSIGLGVLFFLHRKHEEDLDQLERDTAIECLDFAAEHYEKKLRDKKGYEKTGYSVSTGEPVIICEEPENPCFERDEKSTSEMRTDALARRLDRLKRRHETLMHEIDARDAIFSAELERIRTMLAEFDGNRSVSTED